MDALNHSPAELAIVLPITSKDKSIRSHVKVEPREGGLTRTSFVKCEDIRSVSTTRFERRLGVATRRTIDAVEDRLRILLSPFRSTRNRGPIGLVTQGKFELYVPRTVELSRPPGEEDKKTIRGLFEDFFDASAIVLLGDPGMGKTELFQRMAEEEGGRYETVREFLDLRLERFRDRVLYLDGLDEVRTGATDASGPVGRIIGRLDELGMPTFRPVAVVCLDVSAP